MPALLEAAGNHLCPIGTLGTDVAIPARLRAEGDDLRVTISGRTRKLSRWRQTSSSCFFQ